MLTFLDNFIEHRENIPSLGKDCTVEEALFFMMEHNIKHLPIVEDRQLNGIISFESIALASRNFNLAIKDLDINHVIKKTREFVLREDLSLVFDTLLIDGAVGLIELNDDDKEWYFHDLLTIDDTLMFLYTRYKDFMNVESIEFLIKEIIKYGHSNRKGNPDWLKIDELIFGVTGNKKEFSQLTFWDYMRILLDKANWNLFRPFFKLGAENLWNYLDEIREIRNNLAHFRGEISNKQRRILNDCLELFMGIHDQMKSEKKIMLLLTKTNFIMHLDSPLHLWAQMHDRIETVLSAHDRHLFEQGKQVGKAAQEFLLGYAAREFPKAEMSFEQTYVDSHFQARVDGVLHDVEAQVYDLFEVKSASRVKPEHIYDLAFQRFVCEAVIPVRHTYLVHLNSDYVRNGEIDMEELFVIENLDKRVESLRKSVLFSREEAFEIAARETAEGILECVKPKTCPCPSLCHPQLPEHSIYNLPRLSEKKKRGLKAEGILEINGIPDDYKLSTKQALHARAVKSGQPIIDYPAIKESLTQLEYPLYFLDYETFNPAIPQYDGYRPHQHLVFQYSLHVYESQIADSQHYEFIATQPGDPSRAMVEHLAEHIGESGSVIVWNQSFEATRNKDMAARYPEYAEMLLGINTRMYDLMKIFSQGHYVHPDFHGSASIKAVLPVLVGDISYQDLAIGKGDEAMAAWVEIMRGVLTEEQVEQTKQDLLKYCEQDTMAMVRNWEFLEEMVGEGG